MHLQLQYSSKMLRAVSKERGSFYPASLSIGYQRDCPLFATSPFDSREVIRFNLGYANFLARFAQTQSGTKLNLLVVRARGDLRILITWCNMVNTNHFQWN